MTAPLSRVGGPFPEGTKVIRRLLTAGFALGLGVVLLSAPPAGADTSQPDQPYILQEDAGPAMPPSDTSATPDACAADPTYSTWNGTGTFIGDPYRKMIGRGPEVITESTTGSDTVTATFGDTTGLTVGGIIASAQVHVNNDIASAVSSGIVMMSSYAIPSGHLGWLEWGNWGWHYYWSYGHYGAGCVWVTKSGQSNSPQFDGKGFNHGYS